MGEIASQGQYGWTSKAAEKGRVKYLRTTDITSGHLNWDTVPYCQDNPPNVEKYKIEPGDILISRAGSVGFSALIEDVPSTPAVFASYLIRYIPNSQVIPKFIARFLQSPNYWQQISDASAGIALANVNAKKLANVILPLPPLNEQKRIAEKLDSLLARVDSCQTHLERVPQILKRFRQSVLAAATSGRLTGNDENGKEKYLLLSEVIERLKTGPFGSTLHKADYISNGIPFVNPMHINDGRITPSDEMTISKQKAKELKEFLLTRGDVVLARRGVMGRCAVVGEREDGWLCGSGSMLLHPTERLLPEYLQIFLSSPETVANLVEDSVGSTMSNLNQKILMALVIRVPNVEEQAEIVRRVEKLFAYAERLEARYLSASEHVERLTPSLLAKAFRGELVGQEQG
ncbi:MAG: restriction endonuclease subunit S [Anaerolineales bacterium]|nr:restriction endonuclease subunit S [Anaerolineales bacterium]